MTESQVKYHKKDSIEKIGCMEECPVCHKSLKELDLNQNSKGVINEHLAKFPSLRCSNPNCGVIIAKNVF